MNKCKISEKLIELRDKKGITQDELAKSLSVSNKTVSKWENGMSSPNLSMLVALADFYGVSTDLILGREVDPLSPLDLQPQNVEFNELRRRSLIQKIFSRLGEITPINMLHIAKMPEGYKPDVVPSSGKIYRNITSTDDFVDIFSNTDDVNMSVVLLRNKSNFAWLKNAKKQEKLAEIFELLSDKDALSACYFLHSTACSTTFTADYLAENVGIPLEKATEILDRLWRINSCRKMKAHLRDGDSIIYEFKGDARILAILSLAYEKAFGGNSYFTAGIVSAKMIEG